MTAPAGDGGLQSERTRLSWRRTTLTAAVVVVLAGRQAVHGAPSVAAPAGVGVAALVLLAFLSAAQRRMRELTDARPGEFTLGAAVLVSGCVVVLALLGIITAL